MLKNTETGQVEIPQKKLRQQQNSNTTVPIELSVENKENPEVAKAAEDTSLSTLVDENTEQKQLAILLDIELKNDELSALRDAMEEAYACDDLEGLESLNEKVVQLQNSIKQSLARYDNEYTPHSEAFDTMDKELNSQNMQSPTTFANLISQKNTQAEKMSSLQEQMKSLESFEKDLTSLRKLTETLRGIKGDENTTFNSKLFNAINFLHQEGKDGDDQQQQVLEKLMALNDLAEKEQEILTLQEKFNCLKEYSDSLRKERESLNNQISNNFGVFDQDSDQEQEPVKQLEKIEELESEDESTTTLPFIIDRSGDQTLISVEEKEEEITESKLVQEASINLEKLLNLLSEKQNSVETTLNNLSPDDADMSLENLRETLKIVQQKSSEFESISSESRVQEKEGIEGERANCISELEKMEESLKLLENRQNMLMYLSGERSNINAEAQERMDGLGDGEEELKEDALGDGEEEVKELMSRLLEASLDREDGDGKEDGEVSLDEPTIVPSHQEKEDEQVPMYSDPRDMLKKHVMQNLDRLDQLEIHTPSEQQDYEFLRLNMLKQLLELKDVRDKIYLQIKTIENLGISSEGGEDEKEEESIVTETDVESIEQQQEDVQEDEVTEQINQQQQPCTRKIDASNQTTFSPTQQSDNSNIKNLFNQVKDKIYADAAKMISKHEDEPYFLLQVCQKLSLIDSSYARQKILISLDEVLEEQSSALPIEGGAYDEERREDTDTEYDDEYIENPRVERYDHFSRHSIPRTDDGYYNRDNNFSSRTRSDAYTDDYGYTSRPSYLPEFRYDRDGFRYSRDGGFSGRYSRRG